MLALAFSGAAAFNGGAKLPSSRPAVSRAAPLDMQSGDSSIGPVPGYGGSFEKGMADFKADFPWLAKYGFGPTVKAERWNGRHAMFGWFAILMTAVAQKTGFFPDPNTPLLYKDWGALSQTGAAASQELPRRGRPCGLPSARARLRPGGPPRHHKRR